MLLADSEVSDNVPDIRVRVRHGVSSPLLSATTTASVAAPAELAAAIRLPSRATDWPISNGVWP